MIDDPRDSLEDRLRAEAEHAGCGYHRDLYREAANAIDELRARLDAAAAAVDRATVRDPVADLNRLMVDTRAMYEQWREHFAAAVEAEADKYQLDTEGVAMSVNTATRLAYLRAARIVRNTPFLDHDHTGVPGIDPAASPPNEPEPPRDMRYPEGRPGWLGEYQPWPCARCHKKVGDADPHECMPRTDPIEPLVVLPADTYQELIDGLEGGKA